MKAEHVILRRSYNQGDPSLVIGPFESRDEARKFVLKLELLTKNSYLILPLTAPTMLGE